jgi:hypothetical protein
VPFIDFSKLSDKNVYAAFSGVNENHYRYYQYYANSLVALSVLLWLRVRNISS